MPGGIGISIVLSIIGLGLLIFNKALSFHYYQNKPKMEYFQILNIRQRILILGVVAAALGGVGIFSFFR